MTEETASRFTGDHELQIAYHYEQSHEYRSQLGPLDDEGRETGTKAATLLQTAAERALDQDDLVAAGTLAQRALARLEPDAPTRPDLLLLGCEALISSSNVLASEPLLAELATISEGSERLKAWTDSFEGQLTVLRSPDLLVLAEATVAQAAERWTDLTIRPVWPWPAS